ncbi:hypothetical protein [Providencia hangzhouensis]|uniref:tail fiber/spike domain-containing protein n=1 Tax=Providencia hangzhouensis TaxID=3031799 RepID=UPI0034DCC9B9
MTKYDTNNPIGSPSVKDVNDNSINFDHATNDRNSETWQDRLGAKRKTWHGIEKDNERSIAEFKRESDKAIIAAGYAPVGTFQEGAKLLALNEIVLWRTPDGDGENYKWTGPFPKNVPANSTPASTGGIKTESNPNGLWVGVGDASLRHDLNKNGGAKIIGTQNGNLQDVLNDQVVQTTENTNITQAVNAFFPQVFHSFSKERVVIEVKEANALQGNGALYSYRKTKTGWWIKEAIVTGQYSGGASLPSKNCPAWRLGTLHIAPHILTIKQTVTNKTSGVGTYNFTPAQFADGDKKDSVPFHQFQSSASQFIEFMTTTKEKEINILFAATANTSPTMTVRIYAGSALISETKIDTSAESTAGSFTFAITSVKNPRPGSELKVRVVKDKTDAYAYIAGINANFDNHVADDIDKVYTSTYTSKAVRTTQSGAMCYVFYEKGAGKFGGESHGGELPTSQKIIVDTKESVLKNGDVFSCESFRIVQETVIDYENGHKIDCFTEHKFNGDGTHEFTGSFVPTANFQAVYAYCPDCVKTMISPNKHQFELHLSIRIALITFIIF